MTSPQQELLSQMLHESKVVSIVRMISAPISIISSITIVIMIARSSSRLSTTLHRLLVGLSLADIIASTALSFATLPMPKEGVPYAWLAIGNTTTCEIQSFCVVFGGIVTPCYNAGICIFYFIKIFCEFDDEKIRKKVEPFLHGIPIGLGIFLCSYFLANEYFNPGLAVCYISEYPADCSNTPKFPCKRGEGVYKTWAFRTLIVIIFVIVPLIIIGTMTAIYCKVRAQQRRMERFGRGSLASSMPTSTRSTTRNLRRQAYNVKMTMYRGLAYSGAYLITFIFLATMAFGRFGKVSSPSFEMRVLNGACHSLQGFFNFLVFIYPKIIEARSRNPEISLFQAFCNALKSHRGEPTVFRRRPQAPRPRPRDQSSMIVRSENSILFRDDDIDDNNNDGTGNDDGDDLEDSDDQKPTLSSSHNTSKKSSLTRKFGSSGSIQEEGSIGHLELGLGIKQEQECTTTSTDDGNITTAVMGNQSDDR